MLEAADTEWHVSAATVWEMAIKSSLGRLTLPATAEDYIAGKIDSGLRMLAVDWIHAAAVERLPFHHRDPFDRLLIAQARTESLAVVTNDRVFRKYGVQVVW